MTPPSQHGFTLLEVLVALAVIAFALGAVIKATGSATENVDYLQDKTFAHWVGLNAIAELRLKEAWPNTGTRKGKADMAERTWYWEATINDTPDPDMRRMDLHVALDEARNAPRLTTLSAFFARPLKKAPANPNVDPNADPGPNSDPNTDSNPNPNVNPDFRPGFSFRPQGMRPPGSGLRGLPGGLSP